MNTWSRFIKPSSRRLVDRRRGPSFNNSIIFIRSGSTFQSSPAFPKFRTSTENGMFNHRPCFHQCYMGKVHVSSETCLGSSSQTQYMFFGSMAQEVNRHPSFSTINSDDISYFNEILGDKNVIQDEDRLLVANMDWMRKYKGSSKLLLQPRNTGEVSQILKYCNSRRLAVVPQGGNTGLVGGSVPLFDEVIINMGSMNKIISFDKVSGVLVCEAGCILENLVSFLDNEGFIMPLDLGAKGTCHIGGNVSTNAGGLRLLRYGSLHENVLAK